MDPYIHKILSTSPTSPYWTWGYSNTLVGCKQDYHDIQKIADAHNKIVMELEAKANRQGEINDLEDTICRQQAEIERLKRWKNEQMQVVADTHYHEIGEELGWLTLGDNIAASILPAIRFYKREIERLKAIITDAANALSEPR
jgi:prefoldin subunit 5